MKNRLDKVFQDLFRMGDYSSWSPPKTLENIKWFADKGLSHLCDYQNSELLKERMNELFNLGVDPKNKTYLVANVNRAELLDFALNNGADPNFKGKTGLSVCYRSISRGRTDLVRLIISNKNFNFEDSLLPNVHNHNVLLASLIKGRFDLCKDIVAINPSIALRTDSNNLNVFSAVAEYVNFKNNFPQNKTRNIISVLHEIFTSNNISVDSNTNNHFVNMEISKLNAKKLSEELKSSLNNKRTFKL